MSHVDAHVTALIKIANAALAAHRQGSLEQAEQLYRQVIGKLRHPVVLSSFGGLLVQTKRAAEAVPLLRDAADLASDKTAALINLAAALRDTKDLEAARVCLRVSLALSPDNVDAFVNLGAVEVDQRRLDEADRSLAHAQRLRPDNPKVLTNLAVLHHERGDLAAEAVCYERILTLVPDDCDAVANLAVALGDLGRLGEACVVSARLPMLHESRDYARFWHGNRLIAAGRWFEGWNEYRAGHGCVPSSVPPRGVKAPVWDGSPLDGGTLLLYGEQGIGDVLLMMRFLPRVVERVGKVLLAVHRPLVRLLTDQAPPGVRVITLGIHPGRVDALLPIMLLVPTLKLGPDDIGGEPYLSSVNGSRRSWQERLPEGPRPRVGLVWAGNPTYTHDRFRSPGFAAVRPLLESVNVTWVILQVGHGREAMGRLRSNVVDLGDQVQDFADTAAVLCELDSLVTSDTASAHLAGALGVPCRVMAPALMDWRWAVDDSGRSRWYHSIEVIRQSSLTNWTTVIDEVKQRLPS